MKRNATIEFATKRSNNKTCFELEQFNYEKLTKREHSLVLITTLIVKGTIGTSLKYHLLNAKNQGISKIEIMEIFTEVEFYTGWHNIWPALKIIQEVYKDEDETIIHSLFGIGELYISTYKHFIGKVFIKKINSNDEHIVNITLEAKAKSYWHFYNENIILLCTDGVGKIQIDRDGLIKIIKQGSIIVIPKNTEYYYCALDDSCLSFLLISNYDLNLITKWSNI